MLTREIAEARIERLFSLLDRKEGPGWEHLIVLPELDQAVPETCVVGQVYGDYGIGCATLFSDNRAAIEHGVCLPGDKDESFDTGADADYRLLTAVAKEKLIERLKHKPPEQEREWRDQDPGFELAAWWYPGMPPAFAY
jgi:hypothetical protein